MRGRPDPDAFDPEAGPKLDRFALARAVQSLRHLPSFHTVDVLRCHDLTYAHRDVLESEGFVERVERWLVSEALHLGLRGPLPGHDALGKRWAWHLPEADPTGGKGGDLVGPDSDRPKRPG